MRCKFGVSQISMHEWLSTRELSRRYRVETGDLDREERPCTLDLAYSQSDAKAGDKLPKIRVVVSSTGL